MAEKVEAPDYPDVPDRCVQVRFRYGTMDHPYPYSHINVDENGNIALKYLEKSKDPMTDVLEVFDPKRLLSKAEPKGKEKAEPKGE